MNSQQALDVLRGRVYKSIEEFSAGFRPSLSFIEKSHEILFHEETRRYYFKIPVIASPSYSEKRAREIQQKTSWIPLYFRPINDRLKITFDILLTNNKEIIHVLEDFLAKHNLPPKVLYDGYLSERTEIGVSQFVRRYIPNAEEKLIDFINEVVEEMDV